MLHIDYWFGTSGVMLILFQSSFPFYVCTIQQITREGLKAILYSYFYIFGKWQLNLFNMSLSSSFSSLFFFFLSKVVWVHLLFVLSYLKDSDPVKLANCAENKQNKNIQLSFVLVNVRSNKHADCRKEEQKSKFIYIFKHQ